MCVLGGGGGGGGLREVVSLSAQSIGLIVNSK